MKITEQSLRRNVDELISMDLSRNLVAIEFLGNTKDPRAVRPLIKKFKNNPLVRKEVMKSLSEIGGSKALKFLIDIFINTTIYADIRREAQKAIERIEPKMRDGALIFGNLIQKKIGDGVLIF